MVATGELDDQVPPGEAARQPHGRHRRFSSGGNHAQAFDGGHPTEYEFSQFRLGRRGGAKGQSAVDGGMHGFQHCRVGMSQQRRPP